MIFRLMSLEGIRTKNWAIGHLKPKPQGYSKAAQPTNYRLIVN